MQVTVSAGTSQIIGGQEPTPFPNDAAGPRKSLAINLESGDGRWGFGVGITALGGSNAGIPMVVNKPVAFDGETLRFNGTISVFSTAGAVVTFQELRHL